MAYKTRIIGVSGKKQSGKDTLCRYLQALYYVNTKNREYGFRQNTVGIISFMLDSHRADNPHDLEDWCPVYSFAAPIKDLICMRILNIPENQLYGPDKQKNSSTQYCWENMPYDIRQRYSKETKESTSGITVNEHGDDIEMYQTVVKSRTGLMNAREVMQVVGTDIFRKMFSDNVWVDSTINEIYRQSPPIAFICDVRFKTEVDAIVNAGGYIIRLERKISDDDHVSEIDLDNYDFSKFDNRCLSIDNSNLSIEQKNQIAEKWFSKIIESYPIS